MKKRFILALGSTSPEQNGAFGEFAREQGLGWWHWLPNMWLLTDSQGQWTAAGLRDKATDIYGNENVFVLELRADGSDTWAGYGPNTDKRNMFPWLTSNWKK